MIGEITAAKIAGVVGGTFLALVFVLPTSIMDAVRRMAVGLVFGWMVGPLVRDYFEWPGSPERIMASFAIAAFLSWWSLGVASKIAEKIAKKYYSEASGNDQ